MKNKLVIFLALTLSIISCEKNDKTVTIKQISELPSLEGESSITFAESLERWNNLKVENGDSYTYQTGSLSWSGHGSITQIKVVNGVVTEKLYQGFTIDIQSGNKTIDENFIENQSDIGTNSLGAKPITIDEIYTISNDSFLNVDPLANEKILQISSEGILKVCGYTPNGCVDDCFQGVRISGFQWIK